MNKKILTIAISAAMSAGVAATAVQADVKVYGRAQAEVAGIKYKTAQVTAQGSTAAYRGTKTDVIDNGGGTWGISADEDLGSGMKGIGKIEFQTNTSGDSCTTGQCLSDSGAKGDREQFVGLQTGFGTLRLGRVNSPYKLTGVALDPFVTTVLQARGNGGMSGSSFSPTSGAGIGTPLNTHSSGYVNNGIVYNMPKFGGVGLDVYISPDTQNNTSGDLSAALTWAGGPVSIFVAHNLDENANGTTAVNTAVDSKATKVGGQFKFGAAGNLAVQLELLETGAAGAGQETEILFVGYQIPIGKFTPAIQVGLSTTDTAVETETTYAALGVRYNFSKTFSTYGGVRMTETEATTTTVDQEVYTVGMRKDF